MTIISTRQLIDLLKGLSHRSLASVAREDLLRLAERVGRLNSKRNVLVHGHWVFEAIVYTRKGDAILKSHFLRETSPTDPELARQIAKPINQKERVRHCFTLKRIDGTIRDTLALVTAFASFTTTYFPEAHCTIPGPS